MPNYCYNNLYITVEDNKQLDKIIQGITNNSEQLFDFNRIIPIPEELANTSAPNRTNPITLRDKYGFSDWYEWRCANWGTKWNASEVELNLETPEQIYIKFQTAWSPPIPVIKKIAEMFPFAYLTLDWEEESGYYGRTEFAKGVMTFDMEGEMDCAYRIENWGDCHPDCENCGECDCEICNCPNRSIQTICSSCNSGEHAISEERKENEESQTATESAFITTEESN